MFRKNISKAVSIMLCAAMCLGSAPVYAATQAEPAPVRQEEAAEGETGSGEDAGTESAVAGGTETPAADDAGGQEKDADSTQENETQDRENTEEKEPEEEPVEEEQDVTVEEEAEKTGAVSIIDRETGEEIPDDMLSFDREAQYDGYGYLFPGTAKGDSVGYIVTLDGEVLASGSFTLGEYDLIVKAELVRKAPVSSGETKVHKQYGDDDFDIGDYISVPEDYRGTPSYTVEGAEDVISVSGDGMASILSAGETTVRAQFPGYGKYKEAEMRITVVVDRYRMGKIYAESIIWDDLEFPYTGEDTFRLEGTLNGVGADTIRVSADARVSSISVGKKNTTLENISLEGADNYTLDISKEGPKITITGRSSFRKAAGDVEPEKTVAVAFSGPEPVNGMYFSQSRQMDITVTDENFDENLLAVSVNVDGTEYSLSDLRAGIDGASLVTDAEVQEGSVLYAVSFGEGEEVEKKYLVSVTYDGEEALFTGDADKEFVIDNTAPKLSIAYTDGAGQPAQPGTEEGAPFYDLTGMTATLTVEETNFSPEGTSVTVTAKDSAGKDIRTSVYPDGSVNAAKTGTWEEDGKIHSFTMDTFDKDANYSLAAGYTDLAGNEAEPCEEGFFTIDSASPEGSIHVTTADGKLYDYNRLLTEKEKQEGVAEYVFNLFSKKVTLSCTASDKTSGVDKTEYYLADVDGKASDVFTQPTEMEKLHWAEYKEGITVDTDRIAVIYEKITDKAGNITYLSSDGGMVVDTKEPGVPLVMISGEEKDVYNRDVRLDIMATDPDNGGEGVYSGIKKVTYTIKNPLTGKTKEIGAVEVKKPRTRKVEDTVTIKAKENNGNSLEFFVTAQDWSGNTKTEKKVISIDNVKPVVTIKFDASQAKHGHYYNKTQEMDVVFKERNFEPETASLTVMIDGERQTFTMKELEEGRASDRGITVKEILDTEDEKKKDTGKEQDPEEKPVHTDKRTVTYTLLIGDKDGIDTDYRDFEAECTDTAENKAGYKLEETKVITVDKVAPSVTLRFFENSSDVTASVGRSRETAFYTNSTMRVQAQVRERNFSAGGMDMSLSQKDSSGNSVKAYKTSSVDEMSSKDGWNSDGSFHTRYMDTFTGDANYAVSADYTDLAGNRAETFKTRYFTVDRTAPTGTVTVNSQDGTAEYRRYLPTASFLFISNHRVIVTRTAQDETSGVARVQYYRYTPQKEARGTFNALTLNELRNVSWSTWKANVPVTISPNRQAVVYAKITDKAGNVRYISTEGAMIADSQKPVRPNISIDISEPEGKIFNVSVPVSYRVTDPLTGGTYAGLKRVTAEVKNDGTVTQTKTERFDDKTMRTKTMTGSIEVDAAKNNSNDVTVVITAEDYAGNISSSERSLSIDVTNPRIEVTYDRNDPANEKYYNGIRTATIRVYERNFDASGVNIDITSSLGSNAGISSWSTDSRAGRSDDSVSTCTVVYEADSDYTFTMSVQDGAGNTASYGKTDAFTIDRTLPEISVSFDDSDDGRYYNRTRTATITVKERNFDQDAFTGIINASLDGSGIGAPSVSGWSGSGEYHTAAIVFSDDGDYSFDLDETDLAGNAAQQYSHSTFTIDKTAPAVNFSGVKPDSANKNEADASVLYGDINLDTSKVRVLLEGYKHEQRDVTGEVTGRNGTIRLGDFERIIDNDDVYTITATAADLAGNETVNTITFSVNRFGSNYYFGDNTAKFLTSYYHKDAEDLVIYEVNVDSLVNKGITIMQDGTSKTLTPGEYKADDISEKGDWKHYRYTIPKSLFEAEGLYEVVVDSEDAAGNMQNNKMKNAPAAFVIDKTAPGVVITGIEDGEIYNEESREITVSVTDNYSVAGMELFINGEKAAGYTGKEIEEKDGKITYTLKEASDWVTVEAKAEDAAGNTSASDTYKVLLTTSAIRRAIGGGSIPAAGGVLLVTLIAAAAVITRLVSRRNGAGE